jgi:Family of unknown function (DUF6174)
MTEIDEFDSDDQLPRRRPMRLRSIALAMVLGTLLGLGVAVGVLVTLLRGEQLPQVTFDILNAAAERWVKNGPKDYDLDLELSGVNPGIAHIEVRGGEVTAMTLNGRPTAPHIWDNWSAPGLLGIIRRDLEVCMAAKPGDPTAPVARGEFDAHYGYPVRYHRVTQTGADAKWRVTAFVVVR